MSDGFPSEVAEALNKAGGVVPSDLPHAELFGLHSWQLRFGNKLKSVATSEWPLGVDAKGKRHVLYVVAVAANGVSELAQMIVKRLG